MDYGEYELDLNAPQDRPLKRFRPVKDGDDRLRPYTPNSASPGLQPEADQEASGSGEQQAKKGGRKRPLSCGECRRLKLKCDRVFPCHSCRKRGCAEICPDGALTGGKGSRFILANTEQLHDKIKVMSDRIRELEVGLQEVQLKVTSDQHPLLREELLTIKKSPDLFGLEQQGSHHDTAQDVPPKASTSTSVSPRAQSTGGDEHTPRPGVASSTAAPIPPDISQLSHAFPSPWTISPEADLVMRQRIRDHLPSKEEAQRICEQVRENAFWQFLPDASESFLPNLIYSVYTSPLPALMPHRLGLFLMILALGSCVDLHGGDESRQMGEQYYRLSRAALCELPLLEDTSMDAIQALFFMQWFLLAFSEDKKSFEYAWSVSGLTIKLAQTMMLHRDAVRSKIIPEEQDNRRSLFWNLFRFDTRLSLLLRRPPGINMRHVDVKRPTSEVDDPIVTDYIWWQNEFLVQCSIPVVDVTLSVQPPAYTDVLILDRNIRNFEIPISLQIVDDIDHRPPPRPLGMQQAMVSASRLSTIMHLHRSYFTVALTSSEAFTVKHTYAPSVLAVYSGCCNLISTIATIHQWEPELSIRYAMFWNNLFSAACALCFLVSRAPALPIAPTALQELDRVAHLFTQVRHRCPKVASFYHVANKLISRAREHYVAWRNGSPLPRDEMTDEISVLVRKVLPTTTSTPVAPTVALADPFQHAHPFLRRCLEHATALDPCDATGFHLTRIRGYVGPTVTHPQSNMRSDVRPGRASETEPGSGWQSRAGGSNGGSSSSSGFGSAEIADCNWMTWL